MDSRRTITEEGLLRIEEAAKFLGVSRSFVYVVIARGELPVVKLGRATRLPRRAVREYADAHLQGDGESGR